MQAKTLTLLLLAGLLVGCSSAPETFELSTSAISQPSGAAVHLRVIRKPHEALTEIKDPWVYVGVTPYQGKPSLPRTVLNKHARLLLRVSKPGYISQYRQYASRDIDLVKGVSMDVMLKEFSIDAREEKLK